MRWSSLAIVVSSHRLFDVSCVEGINCSIQLSNSDSKDMQSSESRYGWQYVAVGYVYALEHTIVNSDFVVVVLLLLGGGCMWSGH